MRFIVLAAVLALLGSAAHAQTQTLVDMATISMSAPGVPRTVTNTICATDGNDLVCDRGAYLLPNGLISTTNISTSALTVNGVAITGSGGAASPTNVPAFLARSTSGQSIPHGTNTKISFNVEEFDTYNNFSSGRFTPTIPGKYIFTGTVGIDGNVDIFAMLYKNGSVYAWGNRTGLGGGPNQLNYSTFSIVADANGTTDYFEMYVYHTNTGSSASGLIADGARNYFSGSLLASGNGLISGSTALGDRITSGTASGVVAMAGGTISFTTGGTSGTAYLDTLGRFIGAGVSTTGAISAASVYAGASLQLASPTAVTACNSTAAGTIRYNSPTTTLELCTGSGWQPMGVGIPAGTISAFASTTCPTGWSEYTAARGRFLRGIDNGAGNDADGTRAPGATQADLVGSHSHANAMPSVVYPSLGNPDGAGYTTITAINAFNQATPSAGGAETRPKNVAVTFCQFNGTSNGWNNPLSGGSTVAAGTTGQIQYNTGNAFDASANLTWTNASSRLTVTNVSATSLTVGGLTIQQIVASSSTAGTTKLASLTDVTITGAVSGSVLAFNAATSSWTALPIQQVMSTTTMLAGWPDAVLCSYSATSHVMLYMYATAPGGGATYKSPYGTMYYAVYNADGSYASSTDLYNGGPSNCINQAISQKYAAGQAYNFIGTANASDSTALGDRLTSGTSAVTVNSGSGYISLSTASSTWGYLGSAGSYLPQIATAQVSTSTISTTAVQIFSPTTALVCSSSMAGTIRYNSPTTTLELCTGSGWQPMGVGIPAGTISAFASTTCPTGWSEYTAARGRFLRGIDNGAGNDPSGTRAPGAAQADDLKSHTHPIYRRAWYANELIGGGTFFTPTGTSDNANVLMNTNATGGAETRPKNIAVTFCQFNGTSNGWNNPLSGGSTVAAGSTGQVQYNTAGSFDASPDFSWSNGAKILGVAGEVSTSRVSANDIKLSDTGGNCSTAADVGRMFRNPVSGRLQVCAERN